MYNWYPTVLVFLCPTYLTKHVIFYVCPCWQNFILVYGISHPGKTFWSQGVKQSFMWKGNIHKRSKHPPPAEYTFSRYVVALCAAVARPVLLSVPKSTTSEENKLVLKQYASYGPVQRPWMWEVHCAEPPSKGPVTRAPSVRCEFIQRLCFSWGFPGCSVVKEPPCWCGIHRFDPWFGKIPWKRHRPPTLVFLPGKPHGQRGLAGYCHHEEIHTTEQLNNNSMSFPAWLQPEHAGDLSQPLCPMRNLLAFALGTPSADTFSDCSSRKDF